MRRWLQSLIHWLTGRRPAPEHLRCGAEGEHAARCFLERQGWRCLAANYRVPQGEIDLVFRDGEVLVFVEVKTRSDELWERPAAAVDHRKRRRLSRAALSYLNALGRPKIKFRFDIVEVLLPREGAPLIRHWPNAFHLSSPYRYVAADGPAGASARRP